MVGDGTYPDKNVQADAITTSIISNRFLVEAALMPWSMTLYFVDIASMHILVLKVGWADTLRWVSHTIKRRSLRRA